jgi:hypothetical protein
LPANIDRQLADLERRMADLEALEARAKANVMCRRYSDEEIVEILIVYFAYICEADTRRFADFLMAQGDTPEEASKLAAFVSELLEERQRIAPDPQGPL